jgi:hypothetical protein
MRHLLRHLPLVAALAVLALPAPALASPEQAIRDCGFDEDLDRKYSNRDLREAADNLPSDLAEYSGCREILLGAVTGSSDRPGGGGSPGIGGSDPAGETAAQAQDQADLGAIAEGGSDPRVDVGGTSLAPDSSGFFGLGNAANEVPLPLMIALLLLGVTALASGVGGLRERVPALARFPDLSKLPTPRVPFIGRRS